MVRRFVMVASFALLLIPVMCGQSGIPSQVDGWRVEVSPPGNEFYEPPEARSDIAPPSDQVLEVIRILAPHARMDGWEVEDDQYYEIDAVAEDEEYQFLISMDGELVELEYENDLTNVDEEPDEMILQGTREEINANQVPRAALATISEILPNTEPAQCWNTRTVAGQRFVIQMGSLVFYARPDGQITAAGLVDEGALNEISPPSEQTPEEFRAELVSMLGDYRDRFNVDRQKERLRANAVDDDEAFRFVVMGDSRSNENVWFSIVEHISSLQPKPKFIINTGDLVPSGYTEEYQSYFVPPLMKTDIPFFPALGNHDDGDDAMARQYRFLFGENSLNYYFDYGGIRFICMDNVTQVYSYDKTLQWLESVLADTPDHMRKYVFVHKPPANIEKWAYHAWDSEHSEVFTGLMSRYEVEHVFLGHIHAYSTAVYDGVPYTITGGGGAGLHDRFGPQGNIHNYVICDRQPDGSVKQRVVRFYPKE